MDRSSRLAWLVLPVLHLESFPLMNRETIFPAWTLRLGWIEEALFIHSAGPGRLTET